MELARMIKTTASSLSLSVRREAPNLTKLRPPLSNKLLVSPHTLRSIPRFTGGNTCLRCQAQESTIFSAGFLPQVEFYKVESILRPWRLSHVAAALLQVGIRGATVSDVRGFGAQGGDRERQAGSEFGEDSLVTKVKLEVVVSKDQVEMVINTIIDHARTGEIGDGKIFVMPVAEVIRVRTGERGLKAERMVGGRAEILGSNRKAIS